MPKLNLGKVVGDKGDPFVFEDFTSEQLDGLTPKMLKGNVTTLDPDQNATVDIRKEGLNNYIDFGIPRGLNGSEIKSISAENVEMSDGNTLENTMATVNENIAGIEEPVFDDTTDTYASLAESNAAAETASNAIQNHTSIFSMLSNMKKSLSAIVQGLNVLGRYVGGIRGISSALDSQREDIAASSKAVSLLNCNLGIINSTLILSNVDAAITLPANMTTGTELCRTAILQPGLYLIGYRMSNYNLDTVYHINLSTTGNYVSILCGQNGMDVVRLSSPNALVITAQNKSDKPYVTNTSGNNRLFALRLK